MLKIQNGIKKDSRSIYLFFCWGGGGAPVGQEMTMYFRGLVLMVVGRRCWWTSPSQIETIPWAKTLPAMQVQCSS